MNEIQEHIYNAREKAGKFLGIAQSTTGEKRKNAGYELYALTVRIDGIIRVFLLNII